ncbi:MAG TPA: ABC transporter substrate-binding protein [Candidatus Eisenbacteria bacterium]|nr:ABC transporter substrate-binding protein [Candidatus Eisenbacteria bacterium]
MRSPAIPFSLSLVLVLILLAGCGDGGGSDEASSPSGLPEEIVIGAAIAETGYMAVYDDAIVALEQLVRETNARGGIDGHELRVIQADTRSDPQQAVLAVQKVIEDGADVLFFTGEALTAAAGSPLAEEHDKLNFAIVNEPGFGPPTSGRLSFTANPSLLSEVSAAASFLYDKGIRRPFLFRDTTIIYGKAACSGFEQSWEELGGTITDSVDFENTDASISSQVSELKGSDADAVIMCSYPPGGAAAIKQIRAAGVELPIYGPTAFDGLFWLKGIPNTEDIYFTSNGSSYDPPNEATAKLLGSLEEDGINTDIATNLLAWYAGGQMIIEAIEETRSVEGGVLADALEAKPHNTIMGKISYSADDHYPTRAWPVYVLSNGKPKLVTKIEPQFVPEYGE